MTNTPSQRARELLAAEIEAAGSAVAARMLRDGWPAEGATVPALRAIEAALRLPAGEAAPSELRHFAKRNLRNLIELGSTDKALMLSNLEELS